MNHEFVPETPELSQEMRNTFGEKDPNTTYAVTCGDDREQTEESQAELRAAGIDQGDAHIRYFGGAAGVARVLSVTLMASGEAGTLAKLGETEVEVIKNVKSTVEAANKVVLELHSAEDNEGNRGHFDPNSRQGLGCAYASSEAALAGICADDENHYALTLKETQQLYGDTTHVDAVRRANGQYRVVRFGGGETGLSREDYDKIGASVQILSGSHTPANQTVTVINFDPNLISNPAEAHAASMPFYNNDVTQVAEMLIRAYPELGLDPELLLAVMDQDIRATRAALAHGAPEGAAALEVRRLGTPAEAIAYLKSL